MKSSDKFVTPYDIFGIIVRSVGLMLFIYGIWYIPLGFIAMSQIDAEYYWTVGISLFFGLYFLRGAPHLLRFAYPLNVDYDARQSQQNELPTE